ncbi:membrane hypothetical protein [Azospirillaceae bacterium]
MKNRSNRAPRKRRTTVFALITLFIVVSATPWRPALAQAQRVSPLDAETIAYHYTLDKYMMAGCITGAAIGTLTGFLSFAGFSVYMLPYISFGCSAGFITGAVVMEAKEFFTKKDPTSPPKTDDVPASDAPASKADGAAAASKTNNTPSPQS